MRVEDFCIWANKNSTKFMQMGISQHISHNSGAGELPNPTAVVEHSKESMIGQITIWESGFMDVELIDLRSGEQIFWEHYDLAANVDYNIVLSRYLEYLSL